MNISPASENQIELNAIKPFHEGQIWDTSIDHNRNLGGGKIMNYSGLAVAINRPGKRKSMISKYFSDGHRKVIGVDRFGEQYGYAESISFFFDIFIEIT